MIRILAKKERHLSPLTLEHILLGVLGVILAYFSAEYKEFSAVGQVIMLVAYLGALVGLAPVPMPIRRTHGQQVVQSGLLSGVLDSFIILAQLKKLDVQGSEEEKDTWKSLNMIAAIVGGLIIWFGEVYAAGTFNNDGRTGVLSALYIVPPVLVFLGILSLHANRLRVEVVAAAGQKTSTRDVIEFIVGIALLLYFHNPMTCLGILIAYATLTHQAEHLITAFKHETEVSVVIVLVIALFGGEWLVANAIQPLGVAEGAIAPIIPSAIQAVLWGPLYTDPSQHFWVRIANLSTGALIFPISSLVGVMLFQTRVQWIRYMKISIPYAALWYAIMRGWIWLTLDTPIGHMLERWAHTGQH